ncbi:hypothetical protein BDV41DRAFT_551907 [Aspergillus transmontanensis]|uniref:Uncharacterized protein n=1 Tax=Aspergillus transmontanensis TaxID=1034304 RepID=A0A5N6VIK7_9EURO|nr:hypothetical protein BDV41DRAFT_551907 [Aspergillus transmontanensis]
MNYRLPKILWLNFGWCVYTATVNSFTPINTLRGDFIPIPFQVPESCNPLVIYIYFSGKTALLSTTLTARGCLLVSQMKGTIRVMSLNF